MLFSLSACGSNSNTTTEPNDTPLVTIPLEDTTPTTEPKEEDNMKTLELKIDNQVINVIWLDNPSVTALKELAKNGLTINMHEYGGFEHTGMIGSTITSNDSRIDVVPGDIVLYNSSQISIFYNNSSWSYTKLGHIDMSKSELVELLGEEDIIIKLTLK